MDFTLAKPAIDAEKILTKQEQVLVESALKEQGRKLIHCELKPSKNNYFDDHYRGEVEYTPRCRNYSFHQVIIPDGTTVRDTNFTQRDMNNPAITGKNLTFIDCNLVNVLVDPSWTLKGCLACQIDIEAREAAELAEKEKV